MISGSYGVSNLDFSFKLTPEIVEINSKYDNDELLAKSTGTFTFKLLVGAFKVQDHKNNPHTSYTRVRLQVDYDENIINLVEGLENLRLGYYNGNTWNHVSALRYGAEPNSTSGTVIWIPFDDFSDPAVGWGAGGGD